MAGALCCAYAASPTSGGSAGFLPLRTCRTQPSDRPSRAASSGTATPRRYAARNAAFRRCW